MSGGTRFVAVKQDGATPSSADIANSSAGVSAGEQGWQPEEFSEPDDTTMRRAWALPALGLILLIAWSVFFLWALRSRWAAGVSPSEGVILIGNWATPALLVGVVWLIVLRTSRREARRFGEAASLLSSESARLEQRLTVINRELSLAREFIAAEARDLESLGRISSDRLSQHAERLQSLIRDNGAQVEAISSVSGTALENMERLRGHLPVIASSAKDVANSIGHAGRTADGALVELREGLDKLGAASDASDHQAKRLRENIEASLSLFQNRLDQMQAVVDARIEGFEHRTADLRKRMEADEEALSLALRHRAAVLSEEIAQTREAFDAQEADALTSLRSRLSALRHEGNAISRALREGEAGAFERFTEAKDRLEEEIREVLERLDRLDRDALEAARNRISALSIEAGEFDERLAERNREFAAETEQRLSEAAQRHDEETARLARMFAQLDDDLAERLAARERQHQDLSATTETIALRLESLTDRIAAISAFGNQAEEALGASLSLLTERLGVSRDALAGTDASIIQLTDGAVRLLELLQASTLQSREQLPAALESGVKRLEEWERRTGELADTVNTAAGRSEQLAHSIGETRLALVDALGEIEALQKSLCDGAQSHENALISLKTQVATLGQESTELAKQAEEALATAISRLTEAAQKAVVVLGSDSHVAVSTLADRLGEESAVAIDRILRVRIAEAVGKLEQAAGHASGVSREAAIQLRDQLAKVDELTGNLERRVAHARARAEEQVDNDFARRVAVITEALNSYAIDIAKALSTEVTDTAWAAYLRGDRGVFTRRAVRLIEPSEAREVARIYEEDGEFRDHVSRYIHDFEAMLRQLLSTRDGHALGVTLLSSDIGKLYVVLAQAIERLRA